jgi:hypothetical protein
MENYVDRKNRAGKCHQALQAHDWERNSGTVIAWVGGRGEFEIDGRISIRQRLARHSIASCDRMPWPAPALDPK